MRLVPLSCSLSRTLLVPDFIKALQASGSFSTQFLFGLSFYHHSSESIAPESFTNHTPATTTISYYASLLHDCSLEKDLRKARGIHSHMKESGFPDVSLGNKLVDCYLKCGSIMDARMVFERMPQRHIVVWNSLISAYASSHRIQEALRLYPRMLTEKVVPDEFTLSSILKAFSKLGLLPESRKAHANLFVLGLDAENEFLGSTLVSMYAKFGRMREARLIFEKIVEKDLVLVTSFIVACTQNGEYSQALNIFGSMVNDGMMANDFTFASILIACANLAELNKGQLIHGLIIKCGYESCVNTQTSLVIMYSTCRLIESSLKVFNLFSNPNVFTWTAIITSLVQNGREETALSTFCHMFRESMRPNSFTICAILSACSSLSMFQQAKQIHALSVKLGLETNNFAGTALVHTYGKCGAIEMAQSAFENLGKLQLVSVNCMIYGLGMNGHGHEALKLFNQMTDLDFELNNSTFTSVLLACSNSGLLVEGRRIFSLIKSKLRLGPTNDHYACMIDLLGRAGRIEEAESLIRQVQNPDVVIWRTLLSACRIHRNIEVAKRAAQNVLNLEPRDAGAHVLLSNIYASTGNWDAVIRMKTATRNVALKKEPAMSWIEVNQEIHTFTAGDKTHPKFDDICEKLEGLIIKVRELGYVPDTTFVLQNFDEAQKEESLYYHSEKLAIAFGLLSSNGSMSCIRILKNLRVCGDCHSWIKFISTVTGREIIARDAKRFHHFKDGVCSCGDYW